MTSLSRHDRVNAVAVDFAPPRALKRTRVVVALTAAILLVGAIGVVTQLLLR